MPSESLHSALLIIFRSSFRLNPHFSCFQNDLMTQVQYCNGYTVSMIYRPQFTISLMAVTVGIILGLFIFVSSGRTETTKILLGKWSRTDTPLDQAGYTWKTEFKNDLQNVDAFDQYTHLFQSLPAGAVRRGGSGISGIIRYTRYASVIDQEQHESSSYTFKATYQAYVSKCVYKDEDGVCAQWQQYEQAELWKSVSDALAIRAEGIARGRELTTVFQESNPGYIEIPFDVSQTTLNNLGITVDEFIRDVSSEKPTISALPYNLFYFNITSGNILLTLKTTAEIYVTFNSPESEKIMLIQ